jgi:hypothetical protein
MIQTLDFALANDEFACFDWVPPKRWANGTVTFVPYWSHPAATAFGCTWSLQGKAVSNDDAMDAAYGSAATSADTGGTTNDLYIGPTSAAITIGGTPATADLIHFKIGRTAGTLDADARLHGVKIIWTANATTED